MPMDSVRFDALARRVASPTRRQILKGVAAVPLGIGATVSLPKEGMAQPPSCAGSAVTGCITQAGDNFVQRVKDCWRAVAAGGIGAAASDKNYVGAAVAGTVCV